MTILQFPPVVEPMPSIVSAHQTLVLVGYYIPCLHLTAKTHVLHMTYMGSKLLHHVHSLVEQGHFCLLLVINKGCKITGDIW